MFPSSPIGPLTKYLLKHEGIMYVYDTEVRHSMTSQGQGAFEERKVEAWHHVTVLEFLKGY